MKKDESLCDYITLDLLSDFSGITRRFMFGGWGISQQGLFFGLIADGTLYLKVDETNLPLYQQLEGSKPFLYARNDEKAISMSYWSVPEEVMEKRESFQKLVNTSIEVARRKKRTSK